MKDLLVTITDKNSSFGRAPLTAACRGHNNMGVVLNYLIYEASIEAKRNGINKDEVEYVEIMRTQETILKGIHGATQSKKTLTSYTDKFQEWRFIDADPYHHKYRVYFKNVQKAVDNPPPADPPKPRGAHAKKSENDTNGKNTISPNGKNTSCDQSKQIAILTNQMVKMASEMSKMLSRIAKLENERSSESASEDVSGDIFDPLESIRVIKNTKESIVHSSSDEARPLSSFLSFSGQLDRLFVSLQPTGVTNVPTANEPSHQHDHGRNNDGNDVPNSTAHDNHLQAQRHTTDAQKEAEQRQGALNATNLDTNDTTTAGSVRHYNSSGTADHSNGDDGMEDVENVEPSFSHIVNEYTEKGIVGLAICNEQQGSIQETTSLLPTEKQQQKTTTPTLPGLEPTEDNVPSVSNDEKTKGSNKGKGRGKKKQEVINEPVAMPSDDAPWTNETIVQIHEARLGRRYPNGAKRKSDRIRDNELEAAQILVDMGDIWTDNTAENRRRLLKIIDHLENRQNQWWLNTNGNVMPHQLVDKDRIHQMIDELKRLKEMQKKNKQTSGSGQRNWTYNAPSDAPIENLRPASAVLPSQQQTPKSEVQEQIQQKSTQGKREFKLIRLSQPVPTQSVVSALAQ